MEKIVLNIPKFTSEKKTYELFGNNVTVFRDIPYSDKVNCAISMAMKCIIINDGICYKTSLTEAIHVWQLFCWYTNADVHEYTDEEIKALYDAVFMNPTYHELLEYTRASFDVVERICDAVIDYIVKTQSNRFSMNTLADMMFGDNATQTIEDSSALKEWLLEVTEKLGTDDKAKIGGGLSSLTNMIGNSTVSFAKKSTK